MNDGNSYYEQGDNASSKEGLVATQMANSRKRTETSYGDRELNNSSTFYHTAERPDDITCGTCTAIRAVLRRMGTKTGGVLSDSGIGGAIVQGGETYVYQYRCGVLKRLGLSVCPIQINLPNGLIRILQNVRSALRGALRASSSCVKHHRVNTTLDGPTYLL
ncbi:hypothetical protein Tco_0978945 [Tanacetum coccineum]|uniref:Uncharacterized protein n=1 Tax=Tanacetum coccineum TaxID=301880 RepID=A0ABQ5EQ08_9ASTR